MNKLIREKDGRWTAREGKVVIERETTCLGDLYRVWVYGRYRGACGGGLGALERAAARAGL